MQRRRDAALYSTQGMIGVGGFPRKANGPGISFAEETPDPKCNIDFKIDRRWITESLHCRRR